MEKRKSARRSELTKRYIQRNEHVTKTVKRSLGSVDHLSNLFGLEKTAIFELMRAAAIDGDEIAMRFCNGVKSTPSEIIDHQPIDELLALWHVPPAHAIGILVTQLGKYKSAVASMKAAMAMDEVIDATIASAKNINSQIGLEDRKILLRNQEFIKPEPKGPLVSIDQRRVEVNSVSSEFERLIKAAAERPALPPSQEVIDAKED